MRASSACLLGLALIHFTNARDLSPKRGLRGRDEGEILDAGIGFVRGITCDPLLSGNSNCTSNDMHIKEELAAALASKAQVNAVGNIELAELLCDDLDHVLDSTLLRFAISSTETVIAERAYYKVMPGDASTDGKDRKVWIGDVIDPAPSPSTTPSTISLTWTEPCDVESLFLKMVTRREDGSTDALTSMHCDAGTSTEFCLVETNASFKEKAEPKKPKGMSRRSRRSLMRKGDARAEPRRRKLQTKTEIDVLVFYTPEAMAGVSITSPSAMETVIKSYFAESNLGNDHSQILLEYNVVHVTELPYTHEPGSDDALTTMTHSAAVSLIRNKFGADLVHLVGSFEDACGLSAYFADDSASGFGLTNVRCMDDLTIGHEIGHNMGCDHDRDTLADEEEDHAYAYGKRYCTGTDPYVTIMSYTDDCHGGYANYYSNPDVIHLGKPTGTGTENCARRITETMEAVAAYRETGGGGCVSTGGACTGTSDCCDSTCVEGVCGSCIYGQYRGDGECDAGTNTLECGWDDGDCCECSSVTSSASHDASSSFNCLDPDPQCLDNCAGTLATINDNRCDEENNNEDCRWDGGDCCEVSCEADHAEDCNPEDGDYNCLEEKEGAIKTIYATAKIVAGRATMSPLTEGHG